MTMAPEIIPAIILPNIGFHSSLKKFIKRVGGYRSPLSVWAIISAPELADMVGLDGEGPGISEPLVDSDEVLGG